MIVCAYQPVMLSLQDGHFGDTSDRGPVGPVQLVRPGNCWELRHAALSLRSAVASWESPNCVNASTQDVQHSTRREWTIGRQHLFIIVCHRKLWWTWVCLCHSVIIYWERDVKRMWWWMAGSWTFILTWDGWCGVAFTPRCGGVCSYLCSFLLDLWDAVQSLESIQLRKPYISKWKQKRVYFFLPQYCRSQKQLQHVAFQQRHTQAYRTGAEQHCCCLFFSPEFVWQYWIRDTLLTAVTL